MFFYDEVKPTYAELEFLELMGVHRRDNIFVNENTNIVYDKSSIEPEEEKDKKFFNVKDAYVYICDDKNKIVFHREDTHEYRDHYCGVTVVREGKSYTFGEIYPMSDTSRRKGFNDKFVRYLGEIDYVISTNYNIDGGNFLTVDFNANGSHSNINCSISGLELYRPDGKLCEYDLGDTFFEQLYMDEIDNDLDEPKFKDGREFALKVYPLIYNVYRSSLAIPMIFKSNYYEYIRNQRLIVNENFTAAIQMAVEEQKKHLAHLDEEQKKLDSYFNVFTGNHDHERQQKQL